MLEPLAGPASPLERYARDGADGWYSELVDKFGSNCYNADDGICDNDGATAVGLDDSAWLGELNLDDEDTHSTAQGGDWLAAAVLSHDKLAVCSADLLAIPPNMIKRLGLEEAGPGPVRRLDLSFNKIQ